MKNSSLYCYSVTICSLWICHVHLLKYAVDCSQGKGQEASLKAPVLSSEDESENMENEDCLRKQKWAKREKEGKYADYDSNQLYTLLQKVDPDSAKRLHPKNRRKVVR